MKRRDFIKFIGFISGSAALSSCTGHLNKNHYFRTDEIIPFVSPPPDRIPPDAGGGGEGLYFPTVCAECPSGCPALAFVRDKVYDRVHGKYPTKLEGMPNHPITSGAFKEPFNAGVLCIRGQASLYRVYSPDRYKNPLVKDTNGNWREITWKEAIDLVVDRLKEAEKKGLKGVYLSSRTTGSLSHLIDEFCREAGIERLPEFEPINHSAVRKGYEVLFGINELPVYKIEKSDFLLTIGADILESFGNPVYYQSAFAKARENKNFKWFHIEPHLTLTGLSADERFSVEPGTEHFLLSFMLRWIVESGVAVREVPEEIIQYVPRYSLWEVAERTGIKAENIDRLLAKMSRARKPLVIVGGVSTAHDTGLDVAVLGGLIQWAMGMTDDLIDFTYSENYERVGNFIDLRNFMSELSMRKIGVVFLSKVDPASFEGKKFKNLLKNAHFVVGLYDLPNDTAQECDLILPLSHPIESWGDSEPRKGMLSVYKPALEILIPPESDPSNNRPLFNTLPEGDILITILRKYKGKIIAKDFKEYVYRRIERDYGKEVADRLFNAGPYEWPAFNIPPEKLPYHIKELPRVNLNLRTNIVRSLIRNIRYENEIKKPALVLAPSIRWYDGRSKSNLLLNEIPDPITAISYGDYVLVPEDTANRFRIRNIPNKKLLREEVVIAGKEIKKTTLAHIQKGLADGIIVAYMGTIIPENFNVDGKTGELVPFVEVVSIKKTGKVRNVPILSGSFSDHGRGVVPIPYREAKEEHMEEEDMHAWGHEAPPGKFKYPYAKHPFAQLPYPDHSHVHKTYLWAMAVDLDKCVGCSACVAACYIENNVPVAGPSEHLKGREMSWIRVEPYYEENGEVNFVLMMCQQCENATCEPVCPAKATYHNDEGLNVQVWNRCVGTRYCSNNCPYKARRFNWFDYKWESPLDRMLNPDLAVRGKGVMEKCTFCFHRIRKARDLAKDEHRMIKEGELLPACAQTCPSGAIVFGNFLDENSQVYKMSQKKDSYRIFDLLGTEPKVYYLPKVRRRV